MVFPNLNAQTNPSGGTDLNVSLNHQIGTPNNNITGGVFAGANIHDKHFGGIKQPSTGPITTGGFAEYNVNGHGLGITKTHTPGEGSSLTQSARVNLFQDPIHRVDANAFTSQNKLENGFKFNKHGGSLNYSHVNGHSAGIGASTIPNFGTTASLGGNANLWKSPDQSASLNLGGNASRTFGGPFNGQNNFGGSLGLSKRF